MGGIFLGSGKEARQTRREATGGAFHIVNRQPHLLEVVLALQAGGGPADACVGFRAADGVTCAEGEIQVSFSITGTHEENADFGEARTASLVSVAVPGIVLTFD